MERKLEKRVAAAAAGKADAVRVLTEALQGASAALLVELGGHASGPVRQAVAAALWGRTEEPLPELIARLAVDLFTPARLALAQGLRTTPDWAVPVPVIETLLGDDEGEVRFHTAHVAGRHPELHERLLHLLREDAAWGVRQEAAVSLASADARRAFGVLVEAMARDADEDVVRSAGVSAEKHFTELDGDLKGVERPPTGVLSEALKKLDAPPRCPRLAAWLQETIRCEVDAEQLAEFGTDLTRLAEQGELPRAWSVDPGIETILGVLNGQGGRSIVLLGASGAGKTALLFELVHRLREHPDGPWRVLRVSPAELLVGTLYIGEWQTKVQKLVEAAHAPKKVLLYVPNLQELSSVGRATNSDMNVATMLAPYIESGAIAVCGESTPTAFAHGLGQHPELRRLFTQIEVASASRRATRDLLDLVAAEAGAEPDDAALDRLMDLADLYVQGTAQPGRAVGLLRRLLATRGADRITQAALLEVLHESTGIPTRFLDDTVPLDLEEVRVFLEKRVMGQPDAVDSVLDLVTLVKAGLTDADKPAGVLLFVGPTGVGKTELARALAELLFGDPGRLLRFDMSEYATYEAYERLTGKDGQGGQLTGAVREHPFSVLLFDEIEKAHGNVFDLCLGIFDAGRLTDGAGRTADLTRTIIILTSNVGSAVQIDPLVGFGERRPPPPDRQSLDRALRAAFRPEFLNRLDRIVRFRPLGAETAERIARRELALVLERGGIARRRLSVDVDPAVFALLMREGYSPSFGARPLKRTIERLVLLPVACCIAGGAVSAGSVLRLTERGGDVIVDIVPTDEADAEAAEEAAPDLLALQQRVEALLAEIRPLEGRKSDLLERSNASDFWDDRRAAVATLDEIHRLDRVIHDVRELSQQTAITAQNRDADRARRFLLRHEGAADRLEIVLRSADLSDAYVVLSRVRHERGGLDGVAQLARMYLAFARRIGFETLVLDDHEGDELHDDTITLGVHGAGAYALLRPEAGLHKLARGPTDASPVRERDLVRVDVLRMPGDTERLPAHEVELRSRPLQVATGRLGAAPSTEVHLLHRPSMVSVNAWTASSPEEARDALEPLLRARLAARDEGEVSAPPVVRRYVLGPSPLVSDRRSGRTTGNLDRVLSGELERFCVA